MQRFFFCPVCGQKFNHEFLYGKDRLICSECGRVHYENPIVGVAGIVLNQEQKILLVKRANNVSYPGLWCIPCGYLEYDEEVRKGMEREVEEETGLIVKAKEVFAVHSNFHDAKQQTVGIWFMTEVMGGELLAADDAAAVGWFALDHIPDLAFPTDELVLIDLLNGKVRK
mgnify:CR=1 FL=1